MIRQQLLRDALCEQVEYWQARITGAPHGDALAIAAEAARTRYRQWVQLMPDDDPPGDDYLHAC